VSRDRRRRINIENALGIPVMRCVALHRGAMHRRCRFAQPTDRLKLTGEILREQETLFYRMCRLIRSRVNLFSSFFFYRVVRARLYNVTRLFFHEGERERGRERLSKRKLKARAWLSEFAYRVRDFFFSSALVAVIRSRYFKNQCKRIFPSLSYLQNSLRSEFIF